MLKKLGIFPNKKLSFDQTQKSKYSFYSPCNKKNQTQNYLTQENFRQKQINEMCISSPSPGSVIRICTPNPVKRSISKEVLIFNDNIKKFILGSSNNYNVSKNPKLLYKSLLEKNKYLNKKLTPSSNNKFTGFFQLDKTAKKPYNQLNKSLLNINVNHCVPIFDSNDMGVNIVKNSNLSYEEILRIKFNEIKELSININNINDKINVMKDMINENNLKSTEIRNSSLDILNKSCVNAKSEKYIIGDIPILKNDIMKMRNKLDIISNELGNRNLIIFRENLKNNLMVEDINKLNSFVNNIKDDINNIKNQIFLLRKENINMKKKLKLP